MEEQLALSEDEDEEDGGEEEDSDGGWSPEDRDFVPEDLTDLKMRIKVTGLGKGKKKRGKPTRDLRAEAAEDESEEEDERVFSNNYDEVCKCACNMCGEEVDSDQLKKHMTRAHGGVGEGEGEEGVDGGGKRYHKKTWHRCGICGKQVI